ADSEALRKGQCWARDTGGAPIKLEQVVSDRVFLTTVVENAKIGAVRSDRQRRLPLVGRSRIVINSDGRPPGDASVGGLHDENIRFIQAGWLVVIGDIDVPGHGVDGSVRELVAAEWRRRCCPLPDAGQPEVAICPTD